MQLIKVSPKGQITIPKEARKSFLNNQLLFELKGKIIVLYPVKIHFETDDIEHFSGLAAPSFDFWNNDEDDVYQEFYNKKK